MGSRRWQSKAKPSISYSGSYKAWRIARLDGHLAYTIVNDDDLPTTNQPWDVYKKGSSPPPTICIFATEQAARSAWSGSGSGSGSETKTVAAVAKSGGGGGGGGDEKILDQILALVPKLQEPELNQLRSILAGTSSGSSSSTSNKPNVVFVLGGPGAGKGTMCTLASEQLGWSHLSAGDLLRAERASGGANADLINEYIKEGKIVPVDITVNLIKTAMSIIARETGNINFLIDGFPRSLDNYEGWKRVMGDFATVHCTFFFECPLSVLEERILGRAKYSGRKDDKVESLRLRFATYKNETMPIVEMFRNEKKVVEIDSSQPRQEVWNVVAGKLAGLSDPTKADAPLPEKSEMMLGLIPWPKKEK